MATLLEQHIIHSIWDLVERIVQELLLLPTSSIFFESHYLLPHHLLLGLSHIYRVNIWSASTAPLLVVAIPEICINSKEVPELEWGLIVSASKRMISSLFVKIQLCIPGNKVTYDFISGWHRYMGNIVSHADPSRQDLQWNLIQNVIIVLFFYCYGAL